MTSVTAVIILLTLILALELITRTPSLSSPDTAEAAAELTKAIGEAKAEIEELESQLQEGQEFVTELAHASPQRLKSDITAVSGQLERLRQELTALRGRATIVQEQQAATLAQSSSRQKSRQQLEHLRAEAKHAREQIEKLKNENRMIYNPAPGSSKRPWLLDISKTRVVAVPLGRGVEQIEFSGGWTSGETRLRAWLAERDPAHEYFALLVRPSGITRFQRLQPTIESMGFDFGFDLIGETQAVVDASTKDTSP